MTADELRALGAALYGGAYGWQTAMAEWLGVSSRTVRRWLSGAAPVPADVARILSPGLTGELPRDTWIIGAGTPDARGRRRQYIVHVRYPRFVARVVAVDDEGQPSSAERTADLHTGVVYSDTLTRRGTLLCEIIWIDMPEADEASMHALLGAAVDVLAAAESDDAC